MRRATLLLAVVLGGCAHVQWVAPYSADLQKRATDMLADVVAWEAQMRGAAGTAAADPRSPAVQQKLATWQGDIEAMSAIEVGIDPGSTACDTLLAKIGGAVPAGLKSVLPAAGGGVQPITHCETLPGIFSRMTKQVTATIPSVLGAQCRLGWLPDDAFAAMPAAKMPAATAQQQAAAVVACRALFVPPGDALHGDLVASLVVDLDAIIYREGREAPAAGK